MSEQDSNIQAVKIYNEAFNRGDVDRAIQSFSESTKNHGRVVPRAGIALVLGDIHTRFPGVNLRIDRIVATADQVVVLQIIREPTEAWALFLWTGGFQSG